MKRLVPLGFTKSDIRKELYLSQQEGQEGMSSHVDGGVVPLYPGGVPQEGEGQQEGEEMEKEDGKMFAIQCMQVSLHVPSMNFLK